MFVTVYDNITNAILRVIEVYDPQDASLQAGPGENWLEAQSDPKMHKVVGGQIVDLSEAEKEAVDEPLSFYKDKALREVSSKMHSIRKQFITDIAGQQMIYTSKEQEARDFLAAVPEPTDLTEYPFLAGEIGSTGDTAAQVAQVYLNLSAQWRQVGSQLEAIRIGTNVALGSTTTKTEIQTIMTGFETQIGVFQ